MEFGSFWAFTVKQLNETESTSWVKEKNKKLIAQIVT